MKIPGFKRLLGSDFDKQFQELINQLSLSLNNGIDILYQALNNNLTFRDNIKSQVQDITVSVDANGTPRQNASFKLNISARVDGTLVILAENQDNSNTYPSGGVFINGTQDINNFIINHITGLQANQSYLLRVVIFFQ